MVKLSLLCEDSASISSFASPPARKFTHQLAPPSNQSISQHATQSPQKKAETNQPLAENFQQSKKKSVLYMKNAKQFSSISSSRCGIIPAKNWRTPPYTHEKLIHLKPGVLDVKAKAFVQRSIHCSRWDFVTRRPPPPVSGQWTKKRSKTTENPPDKTKGGKT